MSILSPEIQTRLQQVRNALERGIALAGKCRLPQEEATLKARLKQFDAAALFVVVGEVKAGKSSFINALLGEDICEVAAAPCTAQIQELVYGEAARKETMGDNWERLFLRSEVLREISIVDTPGTNSIIANHQAITESYIPQSDLVIFVFPAKNPHTSTAWELLSFIREEWHRKIVFVLQQSDLTTQDELRENLESVRQYARQRNVQSPVVYAVSAKRERSGDMGSGFAEFRAYLQQSIANGEVWNLKVNGARQTVRRTAESVVAHLSGKHEALEKDRAFLDTLGGVISTRREEVRQLTDLIVRALAGTYDRLATNLKRDFAEGLAVGTVLRRSIPFLRDKDVRQWLGDLETQFRQRAEQQIGGDAEKVSKDLGAALDSLFLDLKQRIELHQSSIVEAQSPTADRIGIFNSLKQKLDDIKLSDLFSEQAFGASSVVNMTLAGGGIVAIGTVIAFATNLIVFDITGGVLAGAGALIVAATLLWKRSGIIAEFESKLDRSGEEFRARLHDEVERICEKIFIELRHRVAAPAEMLNAELGEVAPLLDEARSLLESVGPAGSGEA